MRLLFLLLVFFGWNILPIRVGINSQLSRALASPVLAILASFFIGTIILLFVALIFRFELLGWQTIMSISPSLWVG